MKKTLCLALAAFLGLAACGGGGGGGDGTPTTTPPPQPDNRTMTQRINEARANAGRAPVAWDSALTAAAQDHAEDMAANGFFSHTGSDGSSIGDRVNRRGYGFCYASENIARGQRSEAEVFDAWMNSSGHRTNILNQQAAEYGMASIGSAQGQVWVQVFGRPGC